MSRRRSTQSAVLLVAGSLLLTLLVAESALRAADYPKLQLSGWKFCPKPSECNQFGFRGRPIEPAEDAFRVLLVGDSQVASWAFDITQMPERVLEARLAEELARRVQVFTVGSDGYGQDQQYLALQEYLGAYPADLVLLWYTLGNDLENTTFPVSTSGTPKPTYWLEDGELSGPSEPWFSPATSSLRLLTLLSGYSASERSSDWEARMPAPYQPLAEFAGPVRSDWQREWNDGRPYLFRDMPREMTTKALELTPRSPRTRYAIDLTRALLGAMRDLAFEHGAEFRVFFELRPEVERASEVVAQRLNGVLYLASRAEYRANLDALFDDVPHHRIPIGFPDVQVSERDAHLNQRAVEHVMSELAVRIAHDAQTH